MSPPKQLRASRSFVFRAVELDGRVKTGTIQAEDRDRAVVQLRLQGLLPISVQPDRQLSALLTRSPARTLGKKSVRTLLRALANLTTAHAPLADALGLISASWSVGREVPIIDDVLRQLRQGVSLAKALSSIVPPDVEQIIMAGETSGQLAEALDRSASLLERKAAQTAKIIEACIYPAILVIAAVGALSVLFVVVIPSLQPLVADRLGNLPAFTRLVFATGTVLEHHFASILIGLAVLLSACLLVARTTIGKRFQEQVLFRIPGLSTLARANGEAAVLLTFSSLAQSGISIATALELAAETTSQSVIGRDCRSAVATIRQGQPLSIALRAANFSSDTVLLARVGERTGTLGESLGRAATLCEDRLNRLMERTLSLLGPALTIAIGLVAGLVVAAVFSAVMAVNELGG